MSTPIWAQHAQAVAQRLESIPNYQPIVLVGHSGAGPLLPAIGASSPHPVAAYVFVDASLPHGGRSQLEEMEANSPVLLSSLSSYLEAGGLYPSGPIRTCLKSFQKGFVKECLQIYDQWVFPFLRKLCLTILIGLRFLVDTSNLVKPIQYLLKKPGNMVGNMMNLMLGTFIC